jgi:hypothetical protein
MWDEGISQDLYADNLSDVTSECMSVTSLLVIVEVTMYFCSEHADGTSLESGGSTEHHTQSPLC